MLRRRSELSRSVRSLGLSRPGGVPIAPGAPVKGYTPGSIELGGVEVAPGNAARDVPVYRKGAGGVRVLVTPHRKRKKLGGARLSPLPFRPMTLGNMRELGVRSLAVTCELCHHDVVLPVDAWGDAVPVPAFGPRMVCTRCGIVVADVRPNWRQKQLRADQIMERWFFTMEGRNVVMHAHARPQQPRQFAQP